MRELILNLLKDEEGQGLVEYGIIVALIAVVCIGAVTTLGKTVKGSFETINEDVTSGLKKK